MVYYFVFLRFSHYIRYHLYQYIWVCLQKPVLQNSSIWHSFRCFRNRWSKPPFFRTNPDCSNSNNNNSARLSAFCKLMMAQKWAADWHTKWELTSGFQYIFLSKNSWQMDVHPQTTCIYRYGSRAILNQPSYHGDMLNNWPLGVAPLPSQQVEDVKTDGTFSCIGFTMQDRESNGYYEIYEDIGWDITSCLKISGDITKLPWFQNHGFFYSTALSKLDQIGYTCIPIFGHTHTFPLY